MSYKPAAASTWCRSPACCQMYEHTVLSNLVSQVGPSGSAHTMPSRMHTAGRAGNIGAAISNASLRRFLLTYRCLCACASASPCIGIWFGMWPLRWVQRMHAEARRGSCTHTHTHSTARTQHTATMVKDTYTSGRQMMGEGGWSDNKPQDPADAGEQPMPVRLHLSRWRTEDGHTERDRDRRARTHAHTRTHARLYTPSLFPPAYAWHTHSFTQTHACVVHSPHGVHAAHAAHVRRPSKCPSRAILSILGAHVCTCACGCCVGASMLEATEPVALPCSRCARC